MINIDFYKGKNFALFGLGSSGIAAAKALTAGGASVICWDDNEEARLKAAEHSINLCHLQELDWHNIEALILAPGVPLNYPVPHWSAQLAKKNNVKIIGDIELFVLQRNYFLQEHNLKTTDIPLIVITGTNGKSTTTNLIAHILKTMGKKVGVGGNIGCPILSLPALEKGIFYVVECSSFQLDLAPSINPNVAILLNITPDHIERHGSLENYSNIKKSVIAKANIGFIGENITIEHKPKQKLYQISLGKKLNNEYYIQDAKLYYKNQSLTDLSSVISLLGPHNAQNTLHAIGAIKELLTEETQNYNWQKACEIYQCLPHRMQPVRDINNIRFINDSKATNAEASMQALNSFDNIYWIIGGIAKKGGISVLKPLFPKIKNAYLIGEAAKDFAKSIENSFPFFDCGTLEVAIKQAFKHALQDKQKSVILLSPACASYDQFANYSARGDAFIKIVNNL